MSAKLRPRAVKAFPVCGVFTDASVFCRKAGYGVYFDAIPDSSFCKTTMIPRCLDNNMAEVGAIDAALERIRTLKAPYKCYHIFTDSTNALGVISGAFVSAPQNSLVKSINTHVRSLRYQNVEILFNHVLSKSPDRPQGNRIAHKLARCARVGFPVGISCATAYVHYLDGIYSQLGIGEKHHADIQE